MPFFQDIKSDMKTANTSVTPWHFAWLLLTSSGFMALVFYRMYAPLYRLGHIFKIPAKLLERLTQMLTHCYIEPMAKLEGGIHFPHGVGIVIGADVEVASGTTIYQHVTLGRKYKTMPSAPKIGANSIIYAGAVIVGDVNLAPHSVVGANQFVGKNL